MPASLAFWIAKSTANFPTTGPVLLKQSFHTSIDQFLYLYYTSSAFIFNMFKHVHEKKYLLFQISVFYKFQSTCIVSYKRNRCKFNSFHLLINLV